MPDWVLVCSHSAPATRVPTTGKAGSSASNARLAFHTDGCCRLGETASTAAAGGVPTSVGCAFGSGLKRAPAVAQAVKLAQLSWATAAPVLEKGLDSQTLAAAPWNSPTPPRSCMRRSPPGFQLKPMRGCASVLPSSVTELSMPKPPLLRTTVVPVTLPATCGAAADVLNSGLLGTFCWSTRRPNIRLRALLTFQLSCTKRPALAMLKLAAPSCSVRPARGSCTV